MSVHTHCPQGCPTVAPRPTELLARLATIDHVLQVHGNALDEDVRLETCVGVCAQSNVRDLHIAPPANDVQHRYYEQVVARLQEEYPEPREPKRMTDEELIAALHDAIHEPMLPTVTTSQPLDKQAQVILGNAAFYVQPGPFRRFARDRWRDGLTYRIQVIESSAGWFGMVTQPEHVAATPWITVGIERTAVSVVIALRKAGWLA